VPVQNVQIFGVKKIVRDNNLIKEIFFLELRYMNILSDKSAIENKR